MGKDVEPACFDRVTYQFCDIGRIEAAFECLCISPVPLCIIAVHVERNGTAEVDWAVATVVEHAGLDPAWAQHADTDRAALELRGQHLGQSHRGKLRRRVGACERRSDETVHGSRVDDVAFLSVRLHMRKKDLQAVNKSF